MIVLSMSIFGKESESCFSYHSVSTELPEIFRLHYYVQVTTAMRRVLDYVTQVHTKRWFIIQQEPNKIYDGDGENDGGFLSSLYQSIIVDKITNAQIIGKQLHNCAAKTKRNWLLHFFHYFKAMMHVLEATSLKSWKESGAVLGGDD